MIKLKDLCETVGQSWRSRDATQSDMFKSSEAMIAGLKNLQVLARGQEAKYKVILHALPEWINTAGKRSLTHKDINKIEYLFTKNDSSLSERAIHSYIKLLRKQAQ